MSSTASMSGADATWLHMDRPTNLMIVNTLITLRGRPDWDAVTAAFEQRVVARFPRFTQRVVAPPVTVGLARPYWQTVDHAAARHILRVDLSAVADDGALRAHLAAAAAEPLDPRAPLWQLHLVELAPGGAVGGAVLLRTHHAMADGISLVRVLRALDDGAEPPAPSPDGGPVAQDRQEHTRAGLDLASLAKLVSGRRAGVFGEDLGGTKSLDWTRTVPLADVKRYGAPHGATVNDVALAAIAGGFRRYLPAKAPTEPVEACLPVNLRAAEGGVDDSLGNRFGLVFARLPVEVDDAGARVRGVRAELAAIKPTREARIVFEALTTCGYAPGWGARRWVDAFARRAGLVVTNVAAPQEGLWIGGSTVGDVVPFVPTTGPIGVGLSICSYARRVRIGILVDTAVVPDAGALREALDVELTELFGPG